MAKWIGKRKRTIRIQPLNEVESASTVITAGEKLPIEVDENGVHIKENSGDYTRFLGAPRFHFSPIEYCSNIKEWSLEEEISETIKANIRKYKDPSCAGPKAFRQISLELAGKNERVKPSRGVLYKHTRKNKKSEYMNTIAKEYGKKTEHVKDIASSDEEMTWDNDDYAEVRGKSTRTHPNCVGYLHISVMKAKNGLHVEQSSNDMIAKLEKHAKKIKDMEKPQVERMDEMKKKHVEEIEQIHNKYDGDIEKMQKAIDAHFDFA
ncbi:hypothetical protein ACFE04_017097 [Oxalis oulophora]